MFDGTLLNPDIKVKICFRVATPRHRITVARQDVLRLREREEFVPYRIVRSSPLDRETFFPLFDLIGQGSEREPVTLNVSAFFYHIDDPVRVQRPQTKVMPPHTARYSFNRHTRREDARPA